MNKNNIIDGWNIFNRWKRRFCVAARDPRYAYCLSSYNESHILFEENACFSLNIDDFEYPSDADSRINDRVKFLHDYFVNISFDSGDFDNVVRNILRYQSPNRARSGYAIWLDTRDIGAQQPGCGTRFFGTCTTLFCADYKDYDFGTIMKIVPYDKLLIRNHGGVNWTEQEAKQFLDHVVEDLSCNGIQIEFKEYYNFGYFSGDILAASVTIINPIGVYFIYQD